MKVSALTDELLDYWVARSLGLDTVFENGLCQVVTYADSTSKCYSERRYHDSWANAGPIIEQEEIVWVWVHSIHGRVAVPNGLWECKHKSPIVAAMRFFVVTRFGEEVDDC